jgi:hypothetical protein
VLVPAAAKNMGGVLRDLLPPDDLPWRQPPSVHLTHGMTGACSELTHMHGWPWPGRQRRQRAQQQQQVMERCPLHCTSQRRKPP